MVNYTYSKLPTINFNTTPASIARSATGSVYAVGDTTYTTALNMTLVVGGTVVTSISSDANGLLPDFTLLDRTSCVWKQAGVSFATVLTTSDPVPGPQGAAGAIGATGAQGVPGDVSTWKPTTFYPLNTPVTNPSGDLVKVTTAHTSTGSYDAAKFEATGAAATKLTGVVPDANLRADLTAAALGATYVPRWKPTTAYALGDKVVSPNGDTVTAKAAFTSGASYDANNWDLPANLSGKIDRTVSDFDAGRSLRDAAYRPFYAQLAAGGSQVFILGHSVVNGSSASTNALGFPTLVKNTIRAIDPTATVSISGNPSYTTTQLLAIFAGATANQNATYTSLTIFMGLLNDYYYSVAPATTQANLAALVAKMKLIQPVGKDTPGFLILLEWLRTDAFTPTYTWDEYRAAAKAVANADPSVTILDLGARMGPANTANVNGYYSADKAHPVDKGHRAIADAVGTEILPTTGLRSPAEKSRVSLIQIDPKAGPATLVVGTWALSVNANYIGNGVYYNSTNALNDASSYDIVLAPGTWSFDFTISKNTNGAIATAALDDGYGVFTDLGTIDTYNGSAAYNQMVSLTGNVLAGTIPLRRRLRLTVTGRNASNTTGYYLNLQYIQCRRTA